MLVQTERMSVAAHMMLAFPWVIKMGKICCEILDIHLQENQYHTTTIYFSQNQQIIIYFRKFNSFVFRILLFVWTTIVGDITDNNVKKQVIKASLEKKVNMIIGWPPCHEIT